MKDFKPKNLFLFTLLAVALLLFSIQYQKALSSCIVFIGLVCMSEP